MKQILKSQHKTWLITNLSNYFKDDPCLRFFDNELLLAKLKDHIMKSNTAEELVKSVESSGCFPKYSVYRKEISNFEYPSMGFQIKSLVNGFDAFRSLYMNNNYLKLTKINNEDEIESEDKDKAVENRTSFGQKPNLASAFRVASKGIRTIKDDETSKISYLKRNFKVEYELFKYQVSNATESAFEKYSTPYFIQTDIKNFFPSIKISSLVKLIKNRYPKYPELALILEELEKEQGFEELPIGWILAGFYADLAVIEAFKHFNKNIKKTNLTNSIQHISYVDDIVFFADIKNKDNYQSICSEIIKTFQNSINSVLGQSNISLHTDGEKCKTYLIDQEFIELVKDNFFDFQIISFADDAKGIRWTQLDNIMLPADNDLTLNERLQFYDALNNLKQKIETKEISKLKDLEPYLKRIETKVKTDGDKYIYAITNAVMSFFSDENNKEATNKNFLVLAKRLFNILNHRIRPASSWLNFFSIILKTSNDFQDSKIYESIFSMIDKIKHLKDGDRVILNSYARLIRLKKGLNVKLLNKKQFPAILIDETIRTTKTCKRSALQNLESPCFITYSLSILYSLSKNKRSFYSNFVIRTSSNCPQAQIDLFLRESLYQFYDKTSQADLLGMISALENKITNSSIFNELKIQIANFDTNCNFFNKTRSEKINLLRNLINTLKVKSQTISEKQLIQYFGNYLYLQKKEIYLFDYNFVQFLLKGYACADYYDFSRIVFSSYSSLYTNSSFYWKKIPSFYSSVALDVFGLLRKILALPPRMKYLDKKKFINTLKDASSSLPALEAESDISEINLSGLISDIDQNSNLKVVLATLAIKHDEYHKAGFQFKTRARKRINTEVLNSLKFAKTCESNMVIFPEISLPYTNVKRYLRIASYYNTVLVGGIEYHHDANMNAYNATVVSIPVKRSFHPFNHTYVAFKQFKNFPMTKEFADLKKYGFKYFHGRSINIFKLRNLKNIGVLTCSDFLSLNLKKKLQGRIQTLIIPAQNYDNTTYHHVAQSAIRELYCYCIVCNNLAIGRSFITAPYRKEYRRTLFAIEGKTRPEAHSVEFDVSLIESLQRVDPTVVFDGNELEVAKDLKLKDFKQLPPDWKKAS